MGISIEALRRQFIDLPPELEELYGGRKEVYFFDNTKEIEEGVNLNHSQAADHFLTMLKEAELAGRTITVATQGPMSSGKSNTLILTYERIPSCVKAFKHILDVERLGPNIESQGGTKSCPAAHYKKVLDIIPQLGEEKVVLVDEFQFDTGTPEEVTIFIQTLREKGKHALVAGLNFDFRRQPFGNTPTLLELVDATFVLAARCTTPGCKKIAPFTIRLIDGKPAHWDDPVVLVGKVSEEYFPRCPDCHIVLPPRGGQ